MNSRAYVIIISQVMRSFIDTVATYLFVTIAFLIGYFFWKVDYLSLRITAETLIEILIAIAVFIIWTYFFFKNRAIFPSVFDKEYFIIYGLFFLLTMVYFYMKLF
jgi:hypothetical protein